MFIKNNQIKNWLAEAEEWESPLPADEDSKKEMAWRQERALEVDSKLNVDLGFRDFKALVSEVENKPSQIIGWAGFDFDDYCWRLHFGLPIRLPIELKVTLLTTSSITYGTHNEIEGWWLGDKLIAKTTVDRHEKHEFFDRPVTWDDFVQVGCYLNGFLIGDSVRQLKEENLRAAFLLKLRLNQLNEAKRLVQQKWIIIEEDEIDELEIQLEVKAYDLKAFLSGQLSLKEQPLIRKIRKSEAEGAEGYEIEIPKNSLVTVTKKIFDEFEVSVWERVYYSPL